MRERQPNQRPDKQAGRETQRQRLLRRLGREVGDLRAQLARTRTEILTLLGVEQTRPLSSAEAGRARALTEECERLRWELIRLHQEFDLLRRLPHYPDEAP
jgi:hypothetical protein